MLRTAIAATLLLSVWAAAAPTPKAPVFPEGAAALVNDEPIMEAAVKQALDRACPPPDRRATVRRDVINTLADGLLFEQHLRPTHKVTAADIDKRVEETKTQLKGFGRDFAKMLADAHLTEAEYRQYIMADLRWSRYANEKATDKALADLFKRDKDTFDNSQVRARHILIAPKEADTPKAEARLKAIRKAIEDEVAAGLAKLPADVSQAYRARRHAKLLDEAFAMEAREQSECPTKAKGGDVGWFTKIGLMVTPFANAAFAMKEHEMSDVVRTPSGLHLILFTERKPGKEVKLDDVKEVVKDVFIIRLRDQLAADLRKKGAVHIRPEPPAGK